MIVITGASRGIGRALSDRLTNNGIEVFGVSRQAPHNLSRSMSCDVSSYEEVKNLVKHLKSLGVPITGLINTAGIASMNLALTTPPKVVQEIINTNLLGTIYCCQLIAPLIIRNRGGTIINFSTIAVNLALKGESVYVASKAGVESFSKVFASEMSDFSINVNCISPGPIKTELLAGINESQIASIINQQIITRQFSVEDICDVAEILLDSRAKSLTGQVFNIGGV